MEKHLVNKVPASVFYIPNFISIEEEETILKKVYSAPKPKWTVLSNRRLQDYGGVPHKNGMLAENLPDWLNPFIDRIATLDFFKGLRPNHVLVNEYLPGQGIMPHTDGPIFHPVISTISCGSHTVLNFARNTDSATVLHKLFLEPRSLVVVKDQLYTDYLHSIEERTCDSSGELWANRDLLCGDFPHVEKELERGTRVSLTIRNVPKVSKLKLLK